MQGMNLVSVVRYLKRMRLETFGKRCGMTGFDEFLLHFMTGWLIGLTYYVSKITKK